MPIPEFEGVNEHGNTLDEIHDAFLVIKENLKIKRLLKENMARYDWMKIKGKCDVLSILSITHLIFLDETKMKKTMTLTRSEEVRIENSNVVAIPSCQQADRFVKVTILW